MLTCDQLFSSGLGDVFSQSKQTGFPSSRCSCSPHLVTFPPMNAPGGLCWGPSDFTYPCKWFFYFPYNSEFIQSLLCTMVAAGHRVFIALCSRVFQLTLSPFNTIFNVTFIYRSKGGGEFSCIERSR